MKVFILVYLITILFGCKTLSEITSSVREKIQEIAELEKEYCAEDNKLERDLNLLAIRLIDKDYVPICEEQN